MKPQTLLRIAAAAAFAGVALGAFGAHALKEKLEAGGYTAVWQTAVFYHLVHAVALFALGLFQLSCGSDAEAETTKARASVRVPAWLLLAGIAIFCGSLYLLALTGARWLGAITPIGGLCFLAAWGWLAVRGVSGARRKGY